MVSKGVKYKKDFWAQPAYTQPAWAWPTQAPQQVEVLPSLVTDCKKPYHRNRLFWGPDIGYF